MMGIYDYYCVNCGHKIKGNDISFNFLEFFEKESKFSILISINEFLKLVEKQKTNIVHGVPFDLKFSFADFVEIIATHNKIERVPSALFDVDRILEDKHVLSKLFDTILPNKTIDHHIINNIICKKFSVSNKKKKIKASDYLTKIFVKPFLEDEKTNNILNSLQFSLDSGKNWSDISKMYCPHCEERVLNEAGRCQQILIGMLGLTNIHILDSLKTSLSSKKLDEIKILDDDYNENQNICSFRLESIEDDTQKILSFIDLMGNAYNVRERMVDPDIYKKYPLISTCHAYVLCICSDPQSMSEHGNIIELSEQANWEIIRDLYENLDNNIVIPPLCIVMPKASRSDKNKTDRLPPNIDRTFLFKQINADQNYRYVNHIHDMKKSETKQQLDREWEILNWCYAIYNAMKTQTYLTIMNAATRSTNKMVNIDDLWDWIFLLTGLKMIGDNQKFEHIPVFTESYLLYYEFKSKYRQCYHISQFSKRFDMVKKMFINTSPHDEEIDSAIMSGGFVEEIMTNKDIKINRIVEKWG